MIVETQSKDKIRQRNILSLAFVGDAAYHRYVRVFLAQQTDFASGQLHRLSVAMVNAKAQADAARQLQPMLTEDESDIFRRARNAKSCSAPKNATAQDYQLATAIEAVLGYLLLSGQEARMDALLSQVISLQ